MTGSRGLREPTVAEIADAIGADLIAVHGPANGRVIGVAPLSNAAPNRLSFSRSAIGPDVDYAESIILCPPEQAANLTTSTLIVVKNPRLAFLRLVAQFFPPPRPAPGIHPTAFVEPGASIDPAASIGAFCYVGNDVTIGAGSILYPHVAIYCPAIIGRNVKVFAGTSIGADGFGYERTPDGTLESFPHVGGVRIDDDVDIGANTCIDRGTLADTHICAGAKIDNLVHISHNVRVGARAVVIAQSMVGGSVDIGDEAWLAPSVGILNQKRIGARATVGFGALVVKDVPDGETVMGAPAMPQGQFRETQLALKRLAQPS
jgi:UDP-3-O-[3-hydroxymyristoyl] glucosamine N-acyltransferase